MEKEKFESVNKTFNYTPNSVFTNQWSSLAFGIGMVVVPLIWPFGLRIRRVHIWGIERSGFFNGREKWAKGFENQRV